MDASRSALVLAGQNERPTDRLTLGLREFLGLDTHRVYVFPVFVAKHKVCDYHSLKFQESIFSVIRWNFKLWRVNPIMPTSTVTD